MVWGVQILKIQAGTRKSRNKNKATVAEVQEEWESIGDEVQGGSGTRVLQDLADQVGRLEFLLSA